MSARLALAGLLHVVEPGYPPLAVAVERHSAEAVWQALRVGRGGLGLGVALTASAAARARGYDPAADVDRALACGARLVTPSDDEWPGHRLTWPAGELEPPPLALYVRGGLRLDEVVERSAAVVGARAATSYGATVATELSRGLAEGGCAVVSGAAYGIDVAAHRGALAAGAAPTVAVLACGVDVAYPRGNDRVIAQIAERGLVVSELPPGSHPTRARFLVRNRLIAALPLGTVVVEAADRSGSLATVARARALTRHVMAVPGPVTSPMSAGCHTELRNQAVCVTCAADVLDVIGGLGVDAVEQRRGPETTRDALPVTVRRVLDAVPVRQGAGVAVLARDAGVSVLTVQQVLPPLLAHGLVERTEGGWRLTALGSGRPQALR
ncbi:MAG: DNA-protecting protein DprA [Frankiales bacterium]|nr:DNA-protecting protein DprA [Frankiales bacterium]